jgi:N-sulfoglucosamine sulfohydrolase
MPVIKDIHIAVVALIITGVTNYVITEGLAVPLLIRAPLMSPENRGQVTDFSASLLDLVPTVLDWYGLEYPKYHILKPNQPTTLSGRSLLPVVFNPDDSEVLSEEEDSYFGSHVAHEVTMDYPMRTIVLGSFKLVHNFNYRSPFPIDQDFYMSPTFQVKAVHPNF